MGNAVSPPLAAALGRCLALAAVNRAPYGQAVVSVPDPIKKRVRAPLILHHPGAAVIVTLGVGKQELPQSAVAHTCGIGIEHNPPGLATVMSGKERFW